MGPLRELVADWASTRIDLFGVDISVATLIALALLIVLLVWIAVRPSLATARAIDAVNMWFGRLAAVLVLAAALISAANAGVRYLFDYSSNAYLEIQWYFFAAVVLLGAAETLRQNGHVRVDLVYMSVSDRKRLWIDIGGLVLFLLPFTLLMAWLCFPVAWQAWEIGEMSTNSGGLIRWPVRAVLVLGFALVALQGVSELIKRVAALRGVLAIDTTYEKPQQ